MSKKMGEDRIFIIDAEVAGWEMHKVNTLIENGVCVAVQDNKNAVFVCNGKGVASNIEMIFVSKEYTYNITCSVAGVFFLKVFTYCD